MRITGVEPCDLSRCDEAATFLQSGFWGRFKSRFGWEPLPFALSSAGLAESRPLLLMRRRIAPGVRCAYLPWGPESRGAGDAAALSELAAALKTRLSPGTAFLRADPPWEYDSPPAPLPAPWRRAGAPAQPASTVILNLEQDEEALLAGMKGKWRYNIRLGEKKTAVRLAARARDFADPRGARDAEAALRVFYGLLLETARRDRIAAHGFDYYRGLFALAAVYAPAPPDIRLYLAEAGGEPLAGVITLFRGAEAVYLYGASSNRQREKMPAYALQWRAIRDAKERGASRYDFFGIPPSGDPSHPMAGLYRFKTGFGGAVVHRPGAWDYEYRALPSRLFFAAETARQTIRGLRKKRAALRRSEKSPADPRPP